MLRFSRHGMMGVIAMVLLCSGADAQNFTTSAEVKPILAATKPSWIAVREFNGQDLLYFTNLLSWRCGLANISYAVNGGDLTRLDMEPCHDDTAQPNAMLMDQYPIYITLPLSSVQTVSVTLTYDDDTQDTATFDRKAVQIP